MLKDAFHDVGLRESLWFFLHLPLAARADDFRESLDRLGMDISHGEGLMDILGAFSDAIDKRLANNCGRTDLGEMAQMAAVETFAEVITPQTQGLFGSTWKSLQQAFARLATTRQVSHLGRRRFARLIYKFLDFYLSRALTDHVGEGQRFATLKQVADFSQALETHCNAAAHIVEKFSGDWFAKHHWDTRGDISRELVGKFAYGALHKLTEELKEGAKTDG